MNLKATIDFFIERPITLFLVDSIGALLTAFFMYLMAFHIQHWISMPVSVLKLLAILAVGLSVYSALCALCITSLSAPFMCLVCIGNGLYCLFSLSCVLFNLPQLTLLGIGYFLLEMVLISGLIYIEVNVSTNLLKQSMA